MHLARILPRNVFYFFIIYFIITVLANAVIFIECMLPTDCRVSTFHILIEPSNDPVANTSLSSGLKLQSKMVSVCPLNEYLINNMSKTHDLLETSNTADNSTMKLSHSLLIQIVVSMYI